jgi:hypothetical protein
MAVVQNIKEKVHLPIYDCVNVEPGKQLRSVENSSTLKFFTNVQGKTKLETNLQSASLLPHYNTFEARALRVVISDLPPDFIPDNPKDEPTVDNGDEGLDVLNDDSLPVDRTGTVTNTEAAIVTADIELTLTRAIELLRRADASEDKSVDLDPDDEDVTLNDGTGELELDAEIAAVANVATITLSVEDLKGFIEDLDKEAPPAQQLLPNNGAGTIIGHLVYNTVTSLYVGEKLMIEMPTWFFPAGAGPYSESGKSTTHGEPSPVATFRFAEPIFIDKQQNFRVEIEVPDSQTLKQIQRIYGPFFIWVVLDGYMTRDVQ